MEEFHKKIIIAVVIVIAVSLVSVNMGITGQTVAKPTDITIESGSVIYNRMTARLSVRNSFPNQQIKIYGMIMGDKATSYDLETKNCEPIGTRTSSEYLCEASEYISGQGLVSGQEYYFQASDNHGMPDGNKARFIYLE